MGGGLRGEKGAIGGFDSMFWGFGVLWSKGESRCARGFEMEIGDYGFMCFWIYYWV